MLLGCPKVLHALAKRLPKKFCSTEQHWSATVDSFSNLGPSFLRTTLWKEGEKSRFLVSVQSEWKLDAGLGSRRSVHLLSVHCHHWSVVPGD